LLSIYYCVCSIVVVILFSSILLLNNGNFFEKKDSYNNNNIYSKIDFFNFKLVQNSYAVEENDKDDKDDANNGDDSKDKKDKSIFNFVAVGDWDCTGETEDTVENIVEQDPELVLALGDFSYSGDADCWFKLIQPIADKTKIVMGNHEDEDDYMDFFGLKEQYYSFNYKNMHFLALSTETDYDDDSAQYQFAIKDLEKYSEDPFIDWIIVFYHRHIYGSGSLEVDTDFREIYHPLFDKYKVDLALQGHLHVYERTYPITFNNEDDDEPIVQDNNPTNIYKNPKGPIFLTVGTGGAHDMILSSLDGFAAKGIDGKFGIVDMALENDQRTLTGTFIENGKKKEVMDEFKIIKY
jgi:Calcineurin-like phosphoesterase